MEYSKNEKERIRELRSYNILDTIKEQDYEDITDLASIICDVPISLISFVDEGRQWFKSHPGLPIDETLREHSFCSRAIETPSEPLIVEDSRTDSRFKDNPYVTGSPNIVFYAGIPLVNTKGYALGTVCIIDNKPRVLTDNQLRGLSIIARQAMHLLELRKTNEQLELARNMLQVKNDKLGTEAARLGREVVSLINRPFESKSDTPE